MNAQIRWSADKFVRILVCFCVFMLTVFFVTACSPSPVSTPTPEILEPTETEIIPTPTPEQATPIPPGEGNLTVIVSDTNGQPKNAESGVNIFYEDKLFISGMTNEGVYMTGLPSGIYDIVLQYNGNPVEAQIMKDVIVSPDTPNMVGFELAPEGHLKISIQMANQEEIPYGPYYLDIIQNDLTIFKDKYLTSALTITMQSGFDYDISITCGRNFIFCFDNQTFTHTVEVMPSQTIEETFSLPYDISIMTLDISTKNSVEIIDVASGDTVISQSNWSSYYEAVLESGKDYLVRVKADGKTQEQHITPMAGEAVKLNFK